MVKINENEILISRHELFVLIKAAGAYGIRNNKMLINSRKLTNFCLRFATEIYSIIERHIWWNEKIPEEFTACVMDNITPKEDENGHLFHEDKQAIRALLMVMLQKTRAYNDLKDLRPDPFYGTVAEFKNGGKRYINTKADSGIAMINDILAHI